MEKKLYQALKDAIFYYEDNVDENGDHYDEEGVELLHEFLKEKKAEVKS